MKEKKRKREKRIYFESDLISLANKGRRSGQLIDF